MLSPELLNRLKPSESDHLPKVRQLYLALYAAIIGGELPVNQRLPPSRELATQLQIGRNTVISVYNQLCDEGLLSSDGRRGTTVQYHGEPPVKAQKTPWTLSQRSAKFALALDRPAAFSPGQPDTSLFPQTAWRQALQKAARLPGRELGYQNAPLERLQQAISRYLATYRSLHVRPEQVVVTASTRQSLLLATALFTDPGDTAWVETPGYSGAAEAFQQMGLDLIACSVDSQGLVPPPQAPAPKIIYSTPCFQYPRGMPLSATRRNQLLTLSSEHNVVLFEDDYDSEFRDDSQPRPALASDPDNARVLHAGTFSKLMFPAIRVAWLVLPEAHRQTAQHCLKSLGGGHNSVAQAVVAELMENGTITRHLQRARQTYAQRRRVLLETLASKTLLSAPKDHIGSLNLVVTLTTPCSMTALERSMAAHDIGAVPLEKMQWHKPAPRECRELVIGLGNVDSLQIPATVDRLEKAIAAAIEVGKKRM